MSQLAFSFENSGFNQEPEFLAPCPPIQFVVSNREDASSKYSRSELSGAASPFGGAKSGAFGLASGASPAVNLKSRVSVKSSGNEKSKGQVSHFPGSEWECALAMNGSPRAEESAETGKEGGLFVEARRGSEDLLFPLSLIAIALGFLGLNLLVRSEFFQVALHFFRAGFMDSMLIGELLLLGMVGRWIRISLNAPYSAEELKSVNTKRESDSVAPIMGRRSWFGVGGSIPWIRSAAL